MFDHPEIGLSESNFVNFKIALLAGSLCEKFSLKTWPDEYDSNYSSAQHPRGRERFLSKFWFNTHLILLLVLWFCRFDKLFNMYRKQRFVPTCKLKQPWYFLFFCKIQEQNSAGKLFDETLSSSKACLQCRPYSEDLPMPFLQTKAHFKVSGYVCGELLLRTPFRQNVPKLFETRHSSFEL